MPEPLEQTIRRLASDRCEYCHVPDATSRLKHVLDHVVARQHGGKTELNNLALCCGRCNQFKRPNLSGIDPETGQLTRLFHPRNDIWAEHFRYEGAVLIPLSAVGRTTTAVLSINHPLRIAAREALLQTGVSL
jgi:hypothetical protein